MKTPNTPQQPSRQPNDDWTRLFFPSEQHVASPNLNRVPGGPFGNARLASSADLRSLARDAEDHPERYMHLLDAYAVAHDPSPSVIELAAGLPIPLGTVAPNVLAVGRSGSGKTQKVTLPAAAYAIRAGMSLVWVNVKGKLQTRLIRRIARQYGREHEVKVVAPKHPHRSCGWTGIDGCHDLAVAGNVAECLVASAAGASRHGEGAWTYTQSQEWLKHALAAICTDLPQQQQTLLVIRKVILAGSFREFAEAHPKFSALRKFARYDEGGNRNAETVSATMSEVTGFIDDVAACLATPELNLAHFARYGGIIVLEIDEADVDQLRQFTTLFLGRLISALQQAACEGAGKLNRRTVIVVDELAAAGAVPGIWNVLHTGRERGIHFVAGTQSISQLGSVYGTKAEVVLEGFQSQIAMGGGLDVASAEYFSCKSGMTTIAVPSVLEQSDQDGGGLATTGRNWQFVARPLLLPGDVASPLVHEVFGAPATVFLGDGRTPPFQAYLTSSHEVGQLSRLMDQVAQQTEDDDLRSEPLQLPEFQSDGDALAGSTGSWTGERGMTDEQIARKLTEVKRALDWDNTTGTARTWWEAFENANRSRTALVLRLAEELAKRKATITEFFLAYVYAGIESIEGTLMYLDCPRIKKDREKKKRDAAREAKHACSRNATASEVSNTHVDSICAFVRCPSCTHLVHADAGRCRACGGDLEAQCRSAASAADTPTPPAPKVMENDRGGEAQNHTPSPSRKKRDRGT